MNKLIIIIFYLLLSLSPHLIHAQEAQLYHFKFKVIDQAELDKVTTLISIDNIVNDTIYAFANEKEFQAFKNLKISYTLMPESKSVKAVEMASTLLEMENWDKYPTYDLYIEMMQNWVSQYPEICTLEEIGQLSSGRKLLAIKISDNHANNFEPEPKVFFSSSIHGDETGGYSVLLQLIDHLLAQYGNDRVITALINQTQIFINPLANPDATYRGGNHTIGNATRYNLNNIDLNRNFPDFNSGEHPDGNAHQQETQLMMAFAEKHKFDLGMNMHGGAEVVNYPWATSTKRSPDNAWWKYVGGNYRDSAQANSPTGYLTGVSNGLANSYDWYRITGGRQDYMNYYHGTRQFTLEISGIKLYPTSSLPQLWVYNKAALIGYLREATFGIQGTITNSIGKPLVAKIEVVGYDSDNSEIYSDSLNGFYARYLNEGVYTIKISCPNYADVIIDSIKVLNGKQTHLKQILIEPYSEICIDTALQVKELYNQESDSLVIPITNCGNQVQYISASFTKVEALSWASIKSPSITLKPQETTTLIIYPQKYVYTDTVINLILNVDNSSLYNIPLEFHFSNTKTLTFSKQKASYNLIAGTLYSDSILISNSLNTTQTANFSAAASWISMVNNSLTIPAQDSIWAKFKINSQNIPIGVQQTSISVNDEQQKLTFTIKVNAPPMLEVFNYHKNRSVFKNNDIIQSFLLSNQGGGIIDYSISIANSNLNKACNISPSTASISQADTQLISITIPTKYLQISYYSSQILIKTNFDTLFLPLHLTIDTLPYMQLSTDTLNINTLTNKQHKDSILIKNSGGSILKLSIYENSTFGNNLLNLPNKTNPIPSHDSIYIPYTTNSALQNAGIYYSSLNINNSIIPVMLHVKKASELLVSKFAIVKTLAPNQSVTDTIYISCSGDEILEIDIKKLNDSDWLKCNLLKAKLSKNETVPLIITINTENLSEQLYYDKISLRGTSIVNLPVKLIIEDITP
ncbi:MAG: M14 family zinc carboxypeptidase [Salinivirgaceae bacterium]|jgi:hypothetical protein|nr:M14 family zinc carboxypeptidase [Salinivirgaceae bacterium]